MDGDTDVEQRAVLKHPGPNRWMHWINFPLLLIMIWSGTRIYWANDVYRIGWGDWTLFEFWPDWVYQRLDLNRHLARGLAFHLSFGWLFAINGLAYGTYLILSGSWRKIVPERGCLRDSMRVMAHDLHLRADKPPQGCYNAMQRLTYTAVILLGGLALISGFAIYKPTQLSWLTLLLGGYETARFVHFMVTIGFLVFFVVHLAQVLRAGWSNLSSMITGYEISESPKGPESETSDA